MELFEILLFIFGGIFLILSFFIGKNEDSSSQNQEMNIDISELKKKIENEINTEADNLINEAESKLNKMSNDTIISIDDFSKQTLERIQHNHEEVVFMYHMLQTKEEDLKKSVNEIKISKSDVKSGIEIAREKAKTKAKVNPKKDIDNQTDVVPKQEEIQNISSGIIDINEETKNQKILALYKKKKSVLEISKQLGLGQGEVKLVIDLYGK